MILRSEMTLTFQRNLVAEADSHDSILQPSSASEPSIPLKIVVNVAKQKLLT